MPCDSRPLPRRRAPQIERHPQVVHLPPPHVWQLTPPEHDPARGAALALVATLELRVPRDLGDADVLRLTRWAWEKCVHALGPGGGAGGSTVTVGVVRNE